MVSCGHVSHPTPIKISVEIFRITPIHLLTLYCSAAWFACNNCQLEDHIRFASSPIEIHLAVCNNEKLLRKHEPQKNVPNVVSNSHKLSLVFYFL